MLRPAGAGTGEDAQWTTGASVTERARDFGVTLNRHTAIGEEGDRFASHGTLRPAAASRYGVGEADTTPQNVPVRGAGGSFCCLDGPAGSGRQLAECDHSKSECRQPNNITIKLFHGVRLDPFLCRRISSTWLNRDMPRRGRALLDVLSTKVAVSLLTWRKASAWKSLDFATTPFEYEICWALALSKNTVGSSDPSRRSPAFVDCPG